VAYLTEGRFWRPEFFGPAPKRNALPGDKFVTTVPTYAEGSAATRRSARTATLGILIALSASHMLNDVMQSLAPALYPVFHQRFALSFFQIGLITFVFQLTASFLQPVIGMSLDKRPLNFILPAGMAFTLVGLVLLAYADSYVLILLAVAVVGIGSAVFHPEGSRVARGLGRTAWLRAKPFSGRRQLRAVLGAAARGFHRRALRAALGADLHPARVGRGGDFDRRQPLVRGG
jgi:hypothetical protein